MATNDKMGVPSPPPTTPQTALSGGNVAANLTEDEALTLVQACMRRENAAAFLLSNSQEFAKRQLQIMTESLQILADSPINAESRVRFVDDVLKKVTSYTRTYLRVQQNSADVALANSKFDAGAIATQVLDGSSMLKDVESRLPNNFTFVGTNGVNTLAKRTSAATCPVPKRVSTGSKYVSLTRSHLAMGSAPPSGEKDGRSRAQTNNRGKPGAMPTATAAGGGSSRSPYEGRPSSGTKQPETSDEEREEDSAVGGSDEDDAISVTTQKRNNKGIDSGRSTTQQKLPKKTARFVEQAEESDDNNNDNIPVVRPPPKSMIPPPKASSGKRKEKKRAKDMGLEEALRPFTG